MIRPPWPLLKNGRTRCGKSTKSPSPSLNSMMKPQLRRFLSTLIFLCVTVLARPVAFAQEEAEAAAEPATAAEHTVWETITGGGPLIIMIWVAILATSVVMVTLIVQNIMTLKPNKLSPPPLVQSLQQTIAAGNYQEAWEICNQNRNYLANVVKAGLSRIGRGKEAVEDAVAEHGLREATLLRTRNSYLSVIGVIARSEE